MLSSLVARPFIFRTSQSQYVLIDDGFLFMSFEHGSHRIAKCLFSAKFPSFTSKKIPFFIISSKNILFTSIRVRCTCIWKSCNHVRIQIFTHVYCCSSEMSFVDSQTTFSMLNISIVTVHISECKICQKSFSYFLLCEIPEIIFIRN